MPTADLFYIQTQQSIKEVNVYFTIQDWKYHPAYKPEQKILDAGYCLDAPDYLPLGGARNNDRGFIWTAVSNTN